MLGKAFLKKIEEQLLSERDNLTKNAVKHVDIDTDGDETDKVQGKILLEVEKQLTSRNREKLSQITDALKRLEEKTYGVCQDCEEKISENRLASNPYFVICVSCAEEREAELNQRKSS